MGEYKLIEVRRTFTKIFYEFRVNEIVVGKGWCRKRKSLYKKTTSIFILPEYRRKGYGTKFLKLILGEATERGIEVAVYKVKQDDEMAITFLTENKEKSLRPTITYKFLNQIIFWDELVWY